MRKVMLMVAFALLPIDAVQATVTASVDRVDVELNESFTLELTTDTNIDMQPDLSVLEQDFTVGQASQRSNTTIANGKIRRSKTWTYSLRPKRAGQLIIPAISIGDERSNVVMVVVSEPSYLPPGEAEIFVTSEVDFDETYVQAQVLLTIKVFRSVATRQPSLRDPTVSGVEVLVELAGDDRNYEAIIDGTPYSVVERVFALYPQESGEIQLSPARFEARVLRNGRITGRKVYESESRSITVRPVPPPPVDYPDAAWLPAKDLQLTEDWSRDDEEIVAGEPLTRHITVSALGQLETQIPELKPPTVNGLNIYPDKPELSRRVESGGIRGIRRDQYALIGVAAGTVVLPALELPWWNVHSGEWQVARLPERSITILASAEPPMPESVTTASGVSESGAESEIVPVPSGYWRRVSALLAGLWLLTLIVWWWSSGSTPGRKPREPEPIPLHKQQARKLKSARRAALAGDAAAVREAVLEWGKLQWPDDAPRSIGVLALRVSSPLVEELQELSTLSYGPQGGDWNGEALAKALRSFAVLSDSDDKSKEILPPLLPAKP